MKVNEWLAWLGGARVDVLRETPGDAARFMSMGTVMVGTAAVAAVSAGFAMNTAVRLPVLPAVVVGLLWGLLILSLDRMLVVSMGRRAGFWPNVGTALPRLLLALLIGAVISVPLVLRIFQSEIDGELQTMHAENIVANQQKLDQQFADIPVLVARMNQLQPVASGAQQPGVSTNPDVVAAQAAVKAAQDEYDERVKAEQCELSGECGSGDVGDGPRFREAQQKTAKALADLQAAQTNLDEVRASVGAQISSSAATSRSQAAAELKTLVPALQKRQAERAAAEQKMAETEYDNAGLLARLEALDRLSDGRPLMLLAHWTILLLFVCIELLPVLAKMLTSTGKETLYEKLSQRRDDDILDGDKQWAAAQAGIIAGRVALRQQLENDRAAQQLAAGKAANAELVARQQLIVTKAIDTWAQVAMQRSDSELRRWYEQHTRPDPARVNGRTAPQPRNPTHHP